MGPGAKSVDGFFIPWLLENREAAPILCSRASKYPSGFGGFRGFGDRLLQGFCRGLRAGQLMLGPYQGPAVWVVDNSSIHPKS